MVDQTLNEIKRGDQAKKVLENEIYKEAFKSVQDNILEAMKTSPLGDETTHNRLVIALQVLGQIEKSLTNVMQTGKMAQIQVNDPIRAVK